MSTTSNEMRNRALETLTSVTYDLLVIGGGIVGAGIARDAALRGLKVALIEQHDFAFGTSSRSSRLLHGGLRYLAQGRIGLVREASIEKKVIHRIAAPGRATGVCIPDISRQPFLGTLATEAWSQNLRPALWRSKLWQINLANAIWCIGKDTVPAVCKPDGGGPLLRCYHK